MMKHAEKVNTLQQRLASFSKMLMTTGLVVAGYATMCYMSQQTVATKGAGKLQSSHESSDQGLSAMFNGMSVVIWSMIAAKAKTGMDASSNGQSKTVG